MTLAHPPRVRTLSVAAPAYNEAAVLEALLGVWLAYLRSLPALEAFEIVICDDGSTDGTGEILERLAARNAELRPVSQRPNRGGGAAMTRAIRATRHDWVLLLDADGQFPIEAFEGLSAEAERAGSRAVFGARTRKMDAPFARLGSRVSGGACNLIYGTRYRDFNSACRLVEGPLLRGLPLEARGLHYSTDLTAKLLELGERPVEVSIPHLARPAGQSKRTALGSTAERASFVGYLALRRALIAGRVIDVASPAEA